MKNYPAHSSIRTISGMCCVKNTQSTGASLLECPSKSCQFSLSINRLSIPPGEIASSDVFSAVRAHSPAIGSKPMLGDPAPRLASTHFVHSSATIGVTLLATPVSLSLLPDSLL